MNAAASPGIVFTADTAVGEPGIVPLPPNSPVCTGVYSTPAPSEGKCQWQAWMRRRGIQAPKQCDTCPVNSVCDYQAKAAAAIAEVAKLPAEPPRDLS